MSKETPGIEYDMLVCIRCHKHLDLIVDTAQSVERNTGKHTLTVFAVDGGHQKLAADLRRVFGYHRVYESQRSWYWGAGLFCLLIESIKYFEKIFRFNHFQSIDYDTLYLAPEADRILLDHIISDRVGLLGCYSPSNAKWKSTFWKEREGFEKRFGPVPSTYTPGEGVQGGYMTLTRALIDKMTERGMMGKPFTNAKKYTHIADDHLLPIFVRMCGLDIVNTREWAECRWHARRDPRGLEKKGVRVFHPTKLTPHNKAKSTDIEVRNYFRKLRGHEDLLR